MPDNSNPNNATPGSSSSADLAAEKPKRARSIISQAHLDELSLSEQVVRAAEKDNHAPVLTEGGLDPATMTALKADLGAARDAVSGTTQKATGQKTVTRKEADLRDELVSLIRKVQGKAKQKYATRNKPLLKDYLIGTDWESNRAALEQAGKTILDKLAKDTLPGIKPADVTALKTAWDAYQAVEGEQAGEQTDLRTERGTLSELMEKIKTGRKDVQLAADSEWPASDKANAGTRQEFRLPLNRSLKA